MAARNDESLLFLVEWFDSMPQLKRKYLLKYFIKQNMVEMVDLKSKKTFLKKSPCPDHISERDFVLGGKVLLYSRELDIVDYGDLKTKERFQYEVQSFLVLLPQEIYNYWGKIIDAVLGTDTYITKIKTVVISNNLADDVQNVLNIKNVNLTDGINLSILFAGSNISVKFEEINKIVKNLLLKKEKYFITAFDGSCFELVNLLIENNRANYTATLNECTLCLVKPHAVKSNATGKIIDAIISEGYEISAIKNVMFDKVCAEEFLEVYKDVVPEYKDHVAQLCIGTSIGIEVRAINAVDTFRVTAGPWDVDFAKELKPNTIRALYGVDKIRNAVHCTDLPTDGVSECEYIFNLMQ